MLHLQSMATVKREHQILAYLWIRSISSLHHIASGKSTRISLNLMKYHKVKTYTVNVINMLIYSTFKSHKHKHKHKRETEAIGVSLFARILT